MLHISPPPLFVSLFFLIEPVKRLHVPSLLFAPCTFRPASLGIFHVQALLLVWFFLLALISLPSAQKSRIVPFLFLPIPGVRFPVGRALEESSFPLPVTVLVPFFLTRGVPLYLRAASSALCILRTFFAMGSMVRQAFLPLRLSSLSPSSPFSLFFFGEPGRASSFIWCYPWFPVFDPRTFLRRSLFNNLGRSLAVRKG